ncbi:hypothetical protein TL16_g04296 [Triparma laevis f. inornata]|uniref:Uncharacterized protein n=1 Tax=Triparma laevis f. inornata TaxID=1714386 RepID=A0A9W7A4W1_9STRA|nr:hypothetical protein TL16_g04296 [Triparma laevis f. inornata]
MVKSFFDIQNEEKVRELQKAEAEALKPKAKKKVSSTLFTITGWAKKPVLRPRKAPAIKPNAPTTNPEETTVDVVASGWDKDGDYAGKGYTPAGADESSTTVGVDKKTPSVPILDLSNLTNKKKSTPPTPSTAPPPTPQEPETSPVIAPTHSTLTVQELLNLGGWSLIKHSVKNGAKRDIKFSYYRRRAWDEGDKRIQ